mmetsp:Transcript_18840/g.44140  ORF Transcript_18840/g.44140 Transcript_18840/m.44140 type:complete len:571 (-) Transcript_18840:75-1787(-)
MMVQDNNDADAAAPARYTGTTSLQQAVLVPGSQEGQYEGMPPGPVPSSVSQRKQSGLPPVPLVSQLEGPSEVDGGAVASSISTLSPHSNEDGDGTGQQIGLDAETTIAEAAKPKRGRGRPRKNADKKGTKGRPRKDVAQGPPPSKTAVQSSQPGRRKRGHPSKGTELENAPEDKQHRRLRPDRNEKTSDYRGSIRNGAIFPSTSTGQRTADVSNAGSKYSVGYQAARRKKEVEEQVLANDVDCEYRGPLLDGKSHGKGSVIWEDGTVYEGDFKHGYRTGEGKLIASDGVIFYVGGFYRGALTNGKRTYPDGGVFEGRFHLGGRSKGIYTYPDGRVFEGEYTWFDVRPKGSRASTKGLLTFNSEDDLLDFEGDLMALDPDIDDRSGRRGKLRWKDGSSFDGTWVAGRFDDGTLRCREFLGHYPLAFREFFSCPLYNNWREGKYVGKFKDGEFDGWGIICWLESWTSGSYPDMPSGNCSGTFKGGTLQGHILWTKHHFWIRPSEDADIFFSGTAADGFIWPHVPSSMSPNGNNKCWDWPRPPTALCLNGWFCRTPFWRELRASNAEPNTTPS